MDSLLHFGNNIRILREDMNLSISEFAKAANYNRKGLSKLELGEQDIKLDTAMRIAKFVNRDFSYLFEDDFQLSGRDTVKDYYIETDYYSIFVENYKKKLSNKTQEYVADLLGIYPENFSRVLNKKVTPQISTLDRMADGIDETLASLFRRVGGEGR